MSKPITKVSSIHPTAIMRGDVELADDVSIGAYTILTGPLKIGPGCTIGSHCIVGGEPEHRLFPAAGAIEIGERTVIRDAVIIHHGSTEYGTKIGSNCYIMSRVYIAHDCQVSDDVTIASGCSIGGHSHLQVGANLGMNVSVHQFSTVGGYAMIGMSTPVTKDVPPLGVVAGNPMRFFRENRLSIERSGLDIGSLEINKTGLAYDSASTTATRLIQEFQASSRRKLLFEVEFIASHPRKPR